MSTEDNQMDVECILHDVMDNICKYLKTKELCTVARVSKSWQHAALRETSKRCYIQQLSLAYNNSDNSTDSAAPDLASMLSVKPFASLLIYDKRLGKSNQLHTLGIHGFYEKMLGDFKRQLPNKTITLEVCEYLTTEDVAFEGARDQRELEITGNCSILGLFIPSVRQKAQVRVAWAKVHGHFQEVVDNLIRRLDFNDFQDPKSTVLLFAREHRGFFVADKIVENLQSRFPDGNVTIWGADFGPKLVTGSCHHDNFRRNARTRNVVALRIAGPNVESWSTIIDCRLPRGEIEHKLYTLKEKVSVKRHCTGLLYAPYSKKIFNAFSGRRHGTTADIMRTMKRIFPDVPIVGLFNRMCRAMPVKTIINDYGARAIDECMSLLIISYD